MWIVFGISAKKGEFFLRSFNSPRAGAFYPFSVEFCLGGLKHRNGNFLPQDPETVEGASIEEELGEFREEGIPAVGRKGVDPIEDLKND